MSHQIYGLTHGCLDSDGLEGMPKLHVGPAIFQLSVERVNAYCHVDECILHLQANMSNSSRESHRIFPVGPQFEAGFSARSCHGSCQFPWSHHLREGAHPHELWSKDARYALQCICRSVELVRVTCAIMCLGPLLYDLSVLVQLCSNSISLEELGATSLCFLLQLNVSRTSKHSHAQLLRTGFEGQDHFEAKAPGLSSHSPSGCLQLNGLLKTTRRTQEASHYLCSRHRQALQVIL
mmetsp:Transcript_73073/g.136543  ORF Transcript_73073/g.136543 Transcript_73073/m.136543 type:complete len:236 (+) Transcript_73073:175-882(+)